MDDTPDSLPKRGPTFSRWLIAGGAFLLAPLILNVLFVLCRPGGDSSIFHRRLYSVLDGIFLRHHGFIWCICLAAAVACFLAAIHKIKTSSGGQRGKSLAIAGAWIAGASLIFACLLCFTMSFGCIVTKSLEARQMTFALGLVIRQYEITYSVPVAPDGPVRDYDRLIAVLSGKSPENFRGIQFLMPTRINPKTGRPEYKDPWGNDFIIVLNSSGVIPAGTGGICQTVNASVAVWSKGRNQIDDHGKYDHEWGWVDDIASWRE
jgi:hypothetical protein